MVIIKAQKEFYASYYRSLKPLDKVMSLKLRITDQCCHFWRYIAKSAILGFSLAMENLSWRYIANRRNSAILSLLNRRFWRNSKKPGENGDFKAKTVIFRILFKHKGCSLTPDRAWHWPNGNIFFINFFIWQEKMFFLKKKVIMFSQKLILS